MCGFSVFRNNRLNVYYGNTTSTCTNLVWFATSIGVMLKFATGSWRTALDSLVFGAWGRHVVGAVPVQSDWLNSALSPVVYGDIALSINT